MWPRWLPSRARLPVIAQIAGAFALMAAVTMPQWSDDTTEPPTFTAPPAADTPAASVAPVAQNPPLAPAGPPRPAHLNLDLRHNFRSVDLTVTVDGKRALETTLEGSGKKFGMFGRREDRSFTRTLDLQPGARVVRLRVRSTDDKFEHTRVERFDLGPASVATMRVDIEKSGLSVIADRPAPPPQIVESATVAVAATSAPVLPPAPASEAAHAAAQAAHEAQKASALAGLYRTLRQVLIALGGFIASVASGFLFEEYLKSRNLSPFSPTRSSSALAGRQERRRRLRRSSHDSQIGIDTGLS